MQTCNHTHGGPTRRLEENEVASVSGSHGYVALVLPHVKPFSTLAMDEFGKLDLPPNCYYEPERGASPLARVGGDGSPGHESEELSTLQEPGEVGGRERGGPGEGECEREVAGGARTFQGDGSGEEEGAAAGEQLDLGRGGGGGGGGGGGRGGEQMVERCYACGTALVGGAASANYVRRSG
eukprot:6211793-Pleurochrysis_carterae.AAC.3